MLTEQVQNSQNQDNSYCLLEFGVSNEATFSVILIQMYKAFVHVSLKFKQGNDEKIKKYLSQRVKDQKSSLQECTQKLSEVTDQFSKSAQSNQQLMEDLG